MSIIATLKEMEQTYPAAFVVRCFLGIVHFLKSQLPTIASKINPHILSEPQLSPLLYQSGKLRRGLWREVRKRTVYEPTALGIKFMNGTLNQRQTLLLEQMVKFALFRDALEMRDASPTTSK